VWQLIARRLVAGSQRTILERLARSRLDWLPAGSRFALEKELAEALRWQAFQKWMRNSPKIRLTGRVALFRSQEDRPEAPLDLGWGNHFDVVDIINVDGDHLDMFRQPHRTGLGSRFAEVFGSRQDKETIKSFVSA